MVDFKALEKKWQQAWQEAKLFEANVDTTKPKFFLTFPYPYMNGYAHIGHFYSATRVEVMARYKRMQGFNVLFPQAWHCTGTPIVAAAKRVKDGEAKQIQIMREMGFKDDEIKKFADPLYWVEYFPKEYIKDFTEAGYSIDFRREFITTDLNPHYDKFIKWQFNKLKDLGYVVQGNFPVVWCPKENTPIQDHSRLEGEGEVPQEFTLLKFKFGPDYLIAATLRPETIYGQTNIWVNPEVEYVKAEVDGESWIISEECAEKLKGQDKEIEVKGKVQGKELLGRYAIASFVDKQLLVLPSSFCSPEKGTGIVTSVPSDSPDDWMGLHDLQKDGDIAKQYNLDWEEIKEIKPIPIIRSEDLGDLPAVKVCEMMGIKNQQERKKLEEAKKLVYKKGYYIGIMNDNCGKYADMPVDRARELIKEELQKGGHADSIYELTGKVVCRCLTKGIIKIVSDQWFIDYKNPEWKKKTHECLRRMNIYPEKARQQFAYTIDWLRQWACTHEEGLGTRLPWDNKWLIESLSDSTIYTAYYTIAHLIKEVPLEEVNDKLFDYLFLSRGKKPDVVNVNEMRDEFEYWYPVDIRNSGKDLVQNHLTFYIFNHTAIFPEKYCPRGISINGWNTVNGEKMSKSKGNFVTLRAALSYGADPIRINMLVGGEGLEDANWDYESLNTVIGKLKNIHEFCTEWYFFEGPQDVRHIDFWMHSQINRIIKETTDEMEQMMFRSALQKGFYEMQNIIKKYMKRTNNNPHKRTIQKAIETQLLLLAPFAPHLCEEIWNKLSKDEFISISAWPEFDESKIDPEMDYAESLVSTTIDDVRSVMRLAKLEKIGKVTLFVSEAWKYKFMKRFKEAFKGTRNMGELIKSSLVEGHEKEIAQLVGSLIKNPGKIPTVVLDPVREEKILLENINSIKSEFDTEVEIVKAAESSEKKAQQALPGKVAILVA